MRLYCSTRTSRWEEMPKINLLTYKLYISISPNSTFERNSKFRTMRKLLKVSYDKSIIIFRIAAGGNCVIEIVESFGSEDNVSISVASILVGKLLEFGLSTQDRE